MAGVKRNQRVQTGTDAGSADVGQALASSADETVVGLRSNARLGKMAPQLPQVQVMALGTEILEGPRKITTATVQSGQSTFRLEDIPECGGPGAKLSVLIDGELQVEGIEVTLKNNSPLAAMDGVLNYLEDLQRGGDGALAALVLGGLKRQYNGEPDFSMLVTKAGDTMVFVFDRDQPGPGHAVRLDGAYVGTAPGDIAILGGCHGRHQEKEYATFAASAHMNESIVSCSGGPVPEVRLADLEPTGETIQRQFWRWRDGISGGGRGEYYNLEVPLWSWRKTGQQSLLELDRERIAEAVESMEEVISSDRLSIRLETGKADGVPSIYGHGSVSGPYRGLNFTRDYFHAQFVLGSKEIVGCGVGRTREESLRDLKASLLACYDTIKDMPVTAPERRRTAAIASRISSYDTDTSATMDVYLQKARSLMAKSLEERTPRDFILYQEAVTKEGYSLPRAQVGDPVVVKARYAAEAIRKAFPSLSLPEPASMDEARETEAMDAKAADNRAEGLIVRAKEMD